MEVIQTREMFGEFICAGTYAERPLVGSVSHHSSAPAQIVGRWGGGGKHCHTRGRKDGNVLTQYTPLNPPLTLKEHSLLGFSPRATVSATSQSSIIQVQREREKVSR